MSQVEDRALVATGLTEERLRLKQVGEGSKQRWRVQGAQSVRWLVVVPSSHCSSHGVLKTSWIFSVFLIPFMDTD